MANKYYIITTTQAGLDAIYSNNRPILVGNKDNQKWSNAGTEVLVKTKSGYTGTISGVVVASKIRTDSNAITSGLDWNINPLE